MLTLHIPGFSYYDLFRPEKLALLSNNVFNDIAAHNPSLATRFAEYRETKGEHLGRVDISNLLVEVAPYLSSFLARMFGIEEECREFSLRAEREHVIFSVKKDFFIRRALKKVTAEHARAFDLAISDRQVNAFFSAFSAYTGEDREYGVAAVIEEILRRERYVKTSLPEEEQGYLRDLCERLSSNPVLRSLIPAGRDEASLKVFLTSSTTLFEQWLAAHYYRKTPSMAGWGMFRVPAKVDSDHLVEMEVLDTPVPNTIRGHEEHYRRRDGFDLTDRRYKPREVMSEVDYCILCHERDKDSCSKGFPEDGAFRKNSLGYTLKGCPLDQKISESHILEGRGDILGALALITIDNPMAPGTGHRICNDCMKACIYQKQDPVNIPQIETRILMDVLNLPWGFEIYSLLTRWNPLNVERPHALPYNGKNVLVVGLGPAGYTMAHYLLNEGFGVVGIDGLKIEPLSPELTGTATTPFQPLRDFSSIYRELSERVLLGFGGVSEYGITVRWDKNFLTVIYLTLLRRERFRIYDGVRFGGTLTIDDVWDLGFDHICYATGAGKPTFVSIKNNLIRGIKKASDFLMALQLTGAGKRESMANLQVVLPAIVIGGGLTAIDTATELMAYYPVQVTKVKRRYDALCRTFGKEAIEASFDREERPILETFLRHADAIEAERHRAASAGEEPNFIPLIRSWGGVQVLYRKSMNDSPAYRLNHEEIIKGLEEGIHIVEKMNPVEAVPDASGALKEMIFERMEVVQGKWKGTGEMHRIPAHTAMVAAGTVPNVMYEREMPGTFQMDRWDEFFQSYVLDAEEGPRLVKSETDGIGFFTSYEKNGRYITFYGDNHPVYEGNVVKAMASARAGYKKVVALFERHGTVGTDGTDSEERWATLVRKLDEDLRPTVVDVQRLTPTITEVMVKAPMAARKFHPGQFYRLQTYEVDARQVEDTLLMLEGLALTGAWVDKEKGLLSMIILEVGASSRMCAMLKPGQRVVVMGPTGAPTEITENGTALLLGGGLGNAVLFSIAKAFKEKNNTVIYFAGYKKRGDFFKREEIEAFTDVVVYSVDTGDPIPTRRPQDKTFVGNIIQAMIAYATGGLGPAPLPLRNAKRIIAIGSDRMMAAVTKARHDVLKPHLHDEHVGIASINSPMQCMMKAVCAQCLQRHVSPETGEETFVFSCFNQDQCMDDVDFANLNARLKTNSLMEKLSDRWLDYLWKKYPMERV